MKGNVNHENGSEQYLRFVTTNFVLYMVLVLQIFLVFLNIYFFMTTIRNLIWLLSFYVSTRASKQMFISREKKVKQSFRNNRIIAIVTALVGIVGFLYIFFYCLDDMSEIFYFSVIFILARTWTVIDYITLFILLAEYLCDLLFLLLLYFNIISAFYLPFSQKRQ